MSAVDNYPSNAYFLIVDGTTIELGSYEFAATGDLKLANMRVYHKKTGAYSYTMQLILAASAGGTALCTSTAETFSDEVTGQITNDWLGDITFTLPNYTVLAGETYYARLAITGYTRTADVSYLGIGCDWLEPIGLTNTAAARIAFGAMR